MSIDTVDLIDPESLITSKYFFPHILFNSSSATDGYP